VKYKSSAKILSFFLVLSVLFLGSYTYFAKPVSAAEATFGLVRLDRMKAAAVATGGTVCLKPSASDTTVTTIAVAFSNGNGSTTGFTLGLAATFAATVTDLPYFGPYASRVQATAFPGINGISPVVGGQSITYTVASTSLTAGTVYCFNFGAGLTPRTTPASDLTGTISTNGTPGETATYAVTTITEDQIAVTATVPVIFNFALSGTSIILGNLSTSAVTSGNVVATIGTNAKNGWVAWLKNSTAGLYSTLQTSAIATTGSYGTIYDLSTTTGYLLDVDATTGSPSIDAAYDGNTADKGGIMQDTYKQIAYKGTPGAADQLTLYLRAKVTTIQAPSSDYADTITIAASGEF